MAQHSREQLTELIAASRMEVRSAAAENLADLAVQELAALIDHTLLKPESTQAQIARLCDEAVQYGFASVCVNPTWVSEAVERLDGTNVKVCSVIGFPLGASLAQTTASGRLNPTVTRRTKNAVVGPSFSIPISATTIG